MFFVISAGFVLQMKVFISLFLDFEIKTNQIKFKLLLEYWLELYNIYTLK